MITPSSTSVFSLTPNIPSSISQNNVMIPVIPIIAAGSLIVVWIIFSK